ncbi:MAG: guanylate kinase [Chloroflexota bacterium]|nr:guanylate kinase [Chloroflexota bacterium]
MTNPLLVVISGPSGVGKDTILEGMRLFCPNLHFVVTATTRPQRQNEINGKDYRFITKPQFEQMIENNEFLEWANVYGNLYGVPKSDVLHSLSEGFDVMIKVDVQGAATIKKLVPEALFIFVAPPSVDDLEGRLKDRKTESDVDFDLRISAAKEELDSLPMFDYVVVNRAGRVELAISEIESIITAEKSRATPRRIDL